MRASVNVQSSDRVAYGEIAVTSPDTRVVDNAAEVRVAIAINVIPRGVVSGLLTVSEARELSLALDAAVIIAEHEMKRLDKANR